MVLEDHFQVLLVAARAIQFLDVFPIECHVETAALQHIEQVEPRDML